MAVKLSKTSKLGTMSWSLQAFETCAGARKADGTEVDACLGCFARGGNYRFKNVKAVREFNKADWQRADWEADMVAALKGESHFRWFDSGDVYSIKLAKKIYNIMVNTPDTLHWLPTRMYKFSKFVAIIDAMNALPNVKVRFSSDSIGGEYVKGLHGSVIIPSADTAPAGVTVCEAYDNGGKCNDCRKCYDKTIDVIAYPQHGRTMKKIFRIMQAAA